jgi:hypothetical protein
MMHLILTACIVWLGALLNPAAALGGPTLDRVRATGVVRCGVSAMLRDDRTDAIKTNQCWSMDFMADELF